MESIQGYVPFKYTSYLGFYLVLFILINQTKLPQEKGEVLTNHLPLILHTHIKVKGKRKLDEMF